MITASDILNYLNSIAPRYMQYEWDNNGLLCGSSSKKVKKILVALDPFEVVCQEAVDIGADLIVTHHPMIFSPIKALTDETDTGRAMMLLIKNNITAINAHTNLDCAPGGVNDTLAEKIGLTGIQIVNPQGEDIQWGLLRCGTVPKQPLTDFMTTVINSLGCQGLRYVDAGKTVHKVAVGGGSCGSDLQDAVSAGCDTFVTADVKYNQFREALSCGINIIDAGHFHTENPVCQVLANKLQEAFPQIQIVLSERLSDPMNFFM